MENSTFVSNMTTTSTGGRTLRLESPMLRGDDVRFVQLRIGATPDGIFGPNTESKLKAFQLANFLMPSGVVDASTMLKLSQISVSGGSNTGGGSTGGVPATTTVTGESRKRWIYLGVAAVGIGVAYASYKK